MKELKEYLQNFNIEHSENEPMSAHTTFKIGGAARIMVFPKNVSEIQKIVKLCRNNQIRVIAVGKGSNLLVADSGLDACVICLGNNFSNVYMAGGETVFAESGASLIKLCRFALENELSGLEFAYGIPGSCGGASFMNAGAYGGEMKDVLIKCTHINKNGDEGELCKKDLDLSYRHSAYYDNNCIITGIFVKLKKSNKEEIESKMNYYMARRKSKQPLEYPSAGSTFKRPQGYFAGALIEECGLKGKSVGGAQVSEKHAGFVINKGGATCDDVIKLCDFCRKTVYRKKGVNLEMEIRVTE